MLIRITNSSPTPVNIINYYLSGSPQFAILTPLPTKLETYIDVEIGFTPNGVGGTKSVRFYLITDTNPATTSILLSESEEDDGTLTIDPSSIQFASGGGSEEVSIVCAYPVTMTVTNLQNCRRSFITIENNTITVPPNNTTSPRSCDVIIAYGPHYRTLHIEQQGLPMLQLSLVTQPEDTCTDAIYLNS